MTSLASVAATASFVGFFGTVLGIMNSFQSVGTSKSAALAAVTGRLSDAMVPGILGFAVAVMAFCFHQYLSNQLEAIELDTNNASLDLTNRLVAYLERLRTSNPAVWGALTRVPRKPAIDSDASAGPPLEGPRLAWARMYRHGVLELIWPQLKSEFDAAAALDVTAWVCYGCGILGWLACWTQQRSVTGALILAFFVVAGIGVGRGSRVAALVTHVYLLTAVCASNLSYGFTFGVLCMAAVVPPLSGGLRAVQWHSPMNRTQRNLPHGWSLLLIALAILTTAALLFGTVLFQMHSYDDSMEPTVRAGDWLMGLNVSIAGPIHRNQLWEVNWGGLLGNVRVIGLPGDRVQIRRGVLVLNGARVREPYCNTYSEASGDFPLPAEAYPEELLRRYHDGAYGDKLDRATEYVVPTNSYFVLNDNREELTDSRTMGPVQRVQFVAKLLVACDASGNVFNLTRSLAKAKRVIH